MKIPQSSSKYVKVEELDGTRVAIYGCVSSQEHYTWQVLAGWKS